MTNTDPQWRDHVKDDPRVLDVLNNSTFRQREYTKTKNGRDIIQARKKQLYCHFALSSAFIILSAVLSIFFVDERSHDHDGKPDQLDGAGLWVPLFSVLLGRVKQAQVKGPNDDGLASVDQTPVHRGQRLDHCKPAEVVKCYANPVRANKGFEP